MSKKTYAYWCTRYSIKVMNLADIASRICAGITLREIAATYLEDEADNELMDLFTACLAIEPGQDEREGV